MQDLVIEELKELVHRKTEETLQIEDKEHHLWMYQNEKEEAKRLQGVTKLRKDEEMAWLLMLTGMLSARRCTRASMEKMGKKCMTPTR